MRLLILSMTLVSVVYGNTYFPMDSRFISSLQLNSNVDLSQKNYKPDSTFDIMKMRKTDINCFINPNNNQDKLYFFSLDNGHVPISRRRRTIHGWTIEKPIYVEEPKWILIEQENQSPGQRHFVAKEDPFYVARGKRIAMEYLQDLDGNQKSHQHKADILDSKLNSKINLWNSSDLPPVYYHPSRVDVSTIQNGDVQPRDKHSDITDMLQEPFFISRGKKYLNKRPDRQLNDAIEFNDDNILRNRRGQLLDQLMKEKDPFYVARGKRSIF